MLNACPKCDELFDYDGFYEHGCETLYWCGCGVIFDKSMKVFANERVDLSGLMEGGRMFIRMTRMKNEAPDE